LVASGLFWSSVWVWGAARLFARDARVVEQEDDADWQPPELEARLKGSKVEGRTVRLEVEVSHALVRPSAELDLVVRGSKLALPLRSDHFDRHWTFVFGLDGVPIGEHQAKLRIRSGDEKETLPVALVVPELPPEPEQLEHEPQALRCKSGACSAKLGPSGLALRAPQGWIVTVDGKRVSGTDVTIPFAPGEALARRPLSGGSTDGRGPSGHPQPGSPPPR
jgi:hypothetical protein